MNMAEKLFKLQSENESDNYGKAISYFMLKGNEMCYDFNFRTAIHDCLDFRDRDQVQDYRSCLIHYLQNIYFDSNISR